MSHAHSAPLLPTFELACSWLSRSASALTRSPLYAAAGVFVLSFFFNDTATTEIYTLSLHDALPIYSAKAPGAMGAMLRREGLYSSHLTHWRQQRDRGLFPRQRGPQSKRDPLFD